MNSVARGRSSLASGGLSSPPSTHPRQAAPFYHNIRPVMASQEVHWRVMATHIAETTPRLQKPPRALAYAILVTALGFGVLLGAGI